jgi:RNA polymerase sigma-70 factor (ECF subfamily)
MTDIDHGMLSRPSVAAGAAALLEGMRRGDHAAYEAFVRQYTGRAVAVARRLLRNEDDARDAVQDAFLQVFRSIDSFRGDANVSTWLHRVVVNAALMKLRSASRRPETSLDELLPVFDEDGHHADPSQTAPLSAEAMVDREQQRALVRACIAQLPDQYRAIITLRDFEELDTGEVAALLGITENAVKIRLHRARQALATLLRREFAREH